VVRHVAQQDAVVVALPPDDSVAHRLSAVADAERGPRYLADPQEFLIEFLFGNFVINFLFDAANSEYVFVRLGVLGDHSVVRLDLGLAGGRKGQRGPLLSAGGRTALWLLRRGGHSVSAWRGDERRGERDCAESPGKLVHYFLLVQC